MESHMTPEQKVSQIKAFAQQFIDLQKNTADPSLKAECQKWINTTFGIARGFAHESNLATATLLKKRELVLQTGGDVVTGKSGDAFFKATEAKSVSTDNPADVDQVLHTAMGQLCGFGRGGGALPEAPDGAVRVIDVLLTSDRNGYPFPQTGRQPHWSLEMLIGSMEQRLREVVMRNSLIFNWLIGTVVKGPELKELRQPQSLPNSSRVVAMGGKPLRLLTVKVRYCPAYEVCSARLGNKQVYLEEMVAHAFRMQAGGADGLEVCVHKIKYTCANDASGRVVREFTRI
jgi:hypothetical protein